MLVKLVHVLSATVLFGTGLGSAYYMFMANRRGDLGGICFATRHVVLADWIFTTPSVIIQPVTGLWLVHLGGYSLTDGWIMWSLGLYVFAAACWLPVVWMQIRMRDMAEAALESGSELPALYWRMNRWWIFLGVLAFSAIVLVFYLMVIRPA